MAINDIVVTANDTAAVNASPQMSRQPCLYSFTHIYTHTPLTGDCYLCIYTFMGRCELHGKQTCTHTHRRGGEREGGGVLFLCGGLDGFRASVTLGSQPLGSGCNETLEGTGRMAHRSLPLIGCCHSDSYLLNGSVEAELCM